MSRDARLVRDPHQKEIVKLFSEFDGSKNRRQIFDDFLWMTAIAISNAVDLAHREEREARYMAIVKQYKPKDMEIFARMVAEITAGMEANPDQDFLGEMYMALDFGSSSAGQFFTPYSVCRAMASIVSDFDRLKAQIEERGFVSVLDPACGAGALLVAFANECMRQGINYQRQVLFVAQDLDHTVACMCYIALSLMGCPGYVVVGVSLAHPSTSRDERGLLPVDNGNVWYTPMFMTRPNWTFRKLAAALGTSDRAAGEYAPVAESAPLQRPETPVEAVTPASISPKAESPSEAKIEAFGETAFGQLTFF